MSKNEIAEMVRKHLTGQKLGDIYFEVDETGIQTGDDWWRVPVRPSRLPEKLYPLYEFLAEIEEEISTSEKHNILLIGGEPLTEDTPINVVA